MATLTMPIPTILPAGEIIAAGISAEEYLESYAEHFHEWVKGVVIKMSPMSARHDLITAYLRQLVDTYLALNTIGRVRCAPFVMHLEAEDTFREPDLQIILNDNPGRLTDTAMIGPADICIEVVSPESATRDYGDKYIGYEQAGVREYWIVDPVRAACHFHYLRPGGLYASVLPDEDGHYRTALLPGLALHVPTLWQPELPTTIETVQAVQAMLARS